MKKLQMFGLAAVALAGSAGGVAALQAEAAAHSEDTNLLAQTSVSLAQAVSIAEARTHGRTVELALEGPLGAPTWEITTVGSGGDQTVEIDAKTGSIKSVEADREDADHHEDGEEDDDGPAG